MTGLGLPRLYCPQLCTTLRKVNCNHIFVDELVLLVVVLSGLVMDWIIIGCF
jgi:hypothetical protein